MITLISRLNGKKTQVGIGDTVYCAMHQHNVRIVKVIGNHVEVSTTCGKILPDYSHIAHLTAYSKGR